MDFVEIPPGKYVVGAGKHVKRLAIAPAETWPQYPLAMPEQMIEIETPYFISRDLVSYRDYPLAKSHVDGDAGLAELSFHQARVAASRMGGSLPRWYEWEIAVRGPEPFLYPWGNELDLDKLALSQLSYSTARGLRTDDPTWLLDDFGEYAHAESPFGLRDLVRVGYEWNAGIAETVAMLRSICDVGAMRYMVPGVRAGTYGEQAEREEGRRAFSGPIAACYGLEKPDGYRTLVEAACFRVVKR